MFWVKLSKGTTCLRWAYSVGEAGVGASDFVAALNFKTGMRNSPQGENTLKSTISRINISSFNEGTGKGEGGIGLLPTCIMARNSQVKLPVDILYHSFFSSSESALQVRGEVYLRKHCFSSTGTTHTSSLQPTWH